MILKRGLIPTQGDPEPEFPFWLPVAKHRTPIRAAPAHTLTQFNVAQAAGRLKRHPCLSG
jgi:hypothetical protein